MADSGSSSRTAISNRTASGSRTAISNRTAISSRTAISNRTAISSEASYRMNTVTKSPISGRTGATAARFLQSATRLVTVTQLLRGATRFVATTLCAITLTTTGAGAAGESIATADSIKLAKTVTVLGHALTLKDTKGTNISEPFIAEYIPDAETFDNWTFMFASRFIPDPNLSPLASAAAIARNVQAKKEAGDIFANSMVMQNDKDKSAVVDFMLSAGPDVAKGKIDVLEHNLFRYVHTPKGLISYQVARRIYPSTAGTGSVEAFIKEIATNRKEYMTALSASDLPLPDYLKEKEGN